MKKEEKLNETPVSEEEQRAEAAPAPEAEEQPGQEEPRQDPEPQQAAQPPETPGEEDLEARLAQQEDKYLRLFAEFDNYRKRTAKEKQASWAGAKAETAAAFLPVYDNLERALKQDTADEAYKKGVEMTMNQFKEVLAKLGIAEIEALGQPFDPRLHNAVMHIEDESFAENTVAEVFQAGFICGEKVVRHAMVKVAN